MAAVFRAVMIVKEEQVSFLIGSRLPYTLLLSGTALILQYAISIPLGLFAAARKGSRFEVVAFHDHIEIYI